VPRFFFDLREGVRFTPDDDGLEFPNIDAAECEAADTAAEIGRDLLPRGPAPAKDWPYFDDFLFAAPHPARMNARRDPVSC
jgi:hypothetical protein